jgi:AraC-like DNA-binding protein
MNIAPGLISFLYISMLVSSLLVTMIYCYFNWKTGILGKMVSITLSVITYGILTTFIASQNFFVYVPHLYKTGHFALLLITPLIYLSLSFAIQNKKLKFRNLFHLIPAFLYLINYIPFFILSKAEKLNSIFKGDAQAFDEGWIFPKYFVLFMNVGQIFFYLALISANIIMNPLSQKQGFEREKKLTYVFIIYLILLLLPPIASFYQDLTGSPTNNYINLVYITSQTIFFTILLNNPQYIYHSVINTEAEKKRKEKVVIMEEIEEKIEINKINIKGPELKINGDINPKVNEILMKIERYFLEKKPFLNYDFTQKDLAEDLMLSNYQIRTTLNYAYSISFSDYVNYHRINYLVKMISEDNKWKTYSTVNLSKSIGFKSTNSFYLAFKKMLGKTPKEFLDEIKFSSVSLLN